jgi:hypothetical protein
MDHTVLLRAGTDVSENQLLRLSFTGHKARLPGLGVIVELHLSQGQIPEDVLGVLWDGTAATLEFAGCRLTVE